MYTFLNASAMRKVSKRNQLRQVYEYILATAKDGLHRLTLVSSIDECTLESLREMGYTVSEHSKKRYTIEW